MRVPETPVFEGLKQRDNLDASRAELQQAITLDPRMAEAHYTLGIIFWQTGEECGHLHARMAAAGGLRVH